MIWIQHQGSYELIGDRFVTAGIQAYPKLIKAVLRRNKKFGRYHTLDMLNDREVLLEECMDKRTKNLVMDFLVLWEESALILSRSLAIL